MTALSPPRLLELAGQSLLKSKALAIDALDILPTEIFPPLMNLAFAGNHIEVLGAMVKAWPFACLPLGALMKDQEPTQEIYQVALEGLDVLLTQDVRPLRWKLRVLDLRKNANQDFWTLWSGTTEPTVFNPMYAFMEPEVAQPSRKRRRVTPEQRNALTPLEVVIEMCLKERTRDTSLNYLFKKVRQWKGALHLCCKKLKIFTVPIPTIRKMLKLVRMDSIQDLEVNCTWKLATLGKFAPFLGQMSNLRRFIISHIHLFSQNMRPKQEQCVTQFANQFLNLRNLEELYLDSISFLEGRLGQVIRCLRSPLETLSITNCVVSEVDMCHLAHELNVTELKDLSLSGVNLTGINPEYLQVLIQRCSTTLVDLDLDECGIVDEAFTAILPALGQCLQLTTLSFCGNPISMAVLENLLCHIIRMSKLSHVLYPAPLESYEGSRGTLHLGRLAHLHTKLKQMLQDLGRPGTIWFSANPCPHCGERNF